ncbi:sushi, von Willebrand factor type A, EGF and pentraxin domain-containing protein 1-like [Ornithodoros turicata]|uniref:sushi, von Willebrand factor type A, EGF and pentraxin domain-containing protein 1-like n=1 Tax=Ornithodoros turicata TaxID=34597 RepID=UPI00313A1DAB
MELPAQHILPIFREHMFFACTSILLFFTDSIEGLPNGRCSAEDDTAHATFYSFDAYKDFYDDGDHANYTCQPGHRTNKVPRYREAVCRNGVWIYGAGNDNLQCYPLNCGYPGNIDHGTVIESVFTFPNSVTFKCDRGYRIEKNVKMYCQSDGKWSPPELPNCARIQCVQLTAPANSKIETIDRDFGGVVRYTCNPGFSAVGNVERHCEGQGTWSGTEPTCEEVKCPKPLAPNHGTFSGTDTRVGSKVTYTCDADGSTQTVVCLIEGFWSQDPIACPAPITQGPSRTESTTKTTSAQPTSAATKGEGPHPVESTTGTDSETEKQSSTNWGVVLVLVVTVTLVVTGAILFIYYWFSGAEIPGMSVNRQGLLTPSHNE